MKNKLIVDAFAASNAQEQAELINEFARTLFVLCGGRYGRNRTGLMHGYETQCYHIVRDLNDDGKAFINDLAEFIKLNVEPIKP